MALQYLPGLARRRLETVVAARLAEEPVIVLQGPRSVGKSTLLVQVATSRGVEVVDLDEPTVQGAVRGNLNGFLATPPPVCIDEYLMWRAIGQLVRVVLVSHPKRGRILLMSTDTEMEALLLL